MQLSPQDAAAALAQVEDARAAMRHVVRAHRGHYHLWIWGTAWTAMPLLAHFGGDAASRHFIWISLLGIAASSVVGFTQSQQIRLPVNVRFVGVIAAVIGFAVLFPFVLHAQPDARSVYAYLCLVAMQVYVVAGLWTDTYLLWLGIAVSALLTTGLFLFPDMFWMWAAIFGGGTLLGTGFYVRHFWR